MHKRLRYHPPGRRCEFPTCITVLNHCNPGPLCLLHAELEATVKPRLEFGHEGMNLLWARIMLVRSEMGLSSGQRRS